MGSSSTETTTSTMDPFQEKVLNYLYDKTYAIAETPYEEYAGTTVAEMDPLMTAAYEGYGGLTTPEEYAAAADVYAGIAAETPEQRMARVRGYKDMYTEGVIDPMMAQAERRRAQERVGEAAGVTKAGAFGNVRRGVFEGEREAAYDTQRDLMVSELMQKGLSYGEAAVAAENQAKMAGALGMTSTAGAAKKDELANLSAMMTAGTIPMDIESAKLKEAYDKFMMEKQYPLASLSGMFTTAGMFPAGIGTSTTTSSTGGMGPALGTLGNLGMSAASMGAFGPAGMAFGGMGMGAGYGMGYGGPLSMGRYLR